MRGAEAAVLGKSSGIDHERLSSEVIIICRPEASVSQTVMYEDTRTPRKWKTDQ